MKFALLLLAVIGITNAAPASNELVQDLRDFMGLIPFGKILHISSNHIENDLEYQAAIKYMQGIEWETMLNSLHIKQSVKEMNNIIKTAGLELETYENILKTLIHSYTITVDPNQKRSFAKFLVDLQAVIPMDKIESLFREKLETSPHFKAFFDAISSDRMHALAEKTLMSKEYKLVSGELMDMDVPMTKIIDKVYEILGWNAATHQDLQEDLSKDLSDFLGLIPLGKIRRMAATHYQNDMEYRAGLKYLQSNEWKTISTALMNQQSLVEIFQIVRNAGLDLEMYLNILDTMINMSKNKLDDVVDGQRRSFASFLKDLAELIPFDKLLTVFNEKMTTSQAFKEFFSIVSSDRMKALADNTIASDEFARAANEFINMDVPIDKILYTVYQLLGWSVPTELQTGAYDI